MNYNPFKMSAVALAVTSATAMTAGVSTSVNAQEVADKELEVITVTGSRIRRADLDSASPVTVIKREDLLVTGLTDVGDLLQRLPSASGSPLGTTTNNGGNGSVQVDLRGLGAQRTLTLVNGQRMVDGGDFQTIPANMIERVDILKDGASAVYGADAVAGVVNIITRRDFEGVELEAQTSTWDETSGAEQTSIGLLVGKTFDSGNFVFGAEFVDQEEAFQSDTPWEFAQDSFYIYPEGCENNLTEPYPTGCYRIGSSRIPEGRFFFPTLGNQIIGTPGGANQAGLLAPFDGRNYNYAPVNYFQTPYERTNIFAEAHFELTENVRFNSEFRANLRKSAQELAPLPYDTGPSVQFADPGFRGSFNGRPFNGISQDNFYLRQAIDRLNAANGTNVDYEPVTRVRRRQIETNRRFEQDVQQFQFFAGLEGDFNGMNWDLHFNQGFRTVASSDLGQFSGTRLQNALGPSADLNGDGRPECYTDINDPNSLIAGCVPLNLFGGGVVDRLTGNVVTSTIPQDQIDYVSTDLIDQAQNEQTIVGGSISGEAFELPGGSLGWAAGFQYWDQELDIRLDSAKLSRNVTGNTGLNTSGSVTSNSVFAEVLAPLYDNGTQNIQLKAGIRYDDFDAFGDDTTWQLGLEARVLESLKLRSTAGTVFRAPTIGDLFGGLQDGFPTYRDPCVPRGGTPIAAGCERVGVQGDSQVLTQFGGNPNLIPETGDTFTAGIVWTPSFGDSDLSLTVDYWTIDLEDGISTLGAQRTLNDCYINLVQEACAAITRTSDFAVASILSPQINVSELGAEGIDIEARYSFSTSIGEWQASFLWAHNLERSNVAFAGEDEVDFAGRFVGATFAEDKVNTTLAWSRNDMSVSWLIEYIGELEADTNCNCGEGNRPDGTYIQDIDAQIYHDLVGSYKFGDSGLSISAGVTNVTDEAPPFIETGFNGGTDPSTYRLFGRGYYARINWKF